MHRALVVEPGLHVRAPVDLCAVRERPEPRDAQRESEHFSRDSRLERIRLDPIDHDLVLIGNAAAAHGVTGLRRANAAAALSTRIC